MLAISNIGRYLSTSSRQAHLLNTFKRGYVCGLLIQRQSLCINQQLQRQFQTHIKTGCRLISTSKIHSAAKSINTDDSHVEQIYFGALKRQIRSVKLFSLITSIGGLIAQPVLMEQAGKIGGTPVIVAVCSFVGFFTFVTPFLLHLITKKYVTEIYHNTKTKEYTAATYTFFLQRKLHTFTVDTVKVPEVPGMFTTFAINNGKTSLFVDAKLFPDPTHYVKIMGYDKPMDFKLDLQEKKSQPATANTTVIQSDTRERK